MFILFSVFRLNLFQPTRVSREDASLPVKFYFALINLRLFAYTMCENNAVYAIIATQLR